MTQPLPKRDPGDGPQSRAASAPGPGQPPRRRRWLRGLLGVILVLALLVAGGVIAQIATGPDVGALARENPETTAFINQYRQQNPSGPLAWTWVPLDNISPLLRRAVLIGEDHRFYQHGGFAWGEIFSAVAESVSLSEGPRGASTLTQQVARNLWLSPERSLGRKLREAVLSKQLEANLDKKRIFEIYLNVAEFGPGLYGAEAAAQHYFQKSAAALNDQEAAQLAAILPDPKDSRPDSPDGVYQARVGVIRERMAIFKDLN